VWKWLVAGTLAFGIAPAWAQAQMRFGRVSQVRMPIGFGNMGFPTSMGVPTGMSFPVAGFQPGSALMRGFPLSNSLGLGTSAYLNRYAMSPYGANSYMMNAYMMSSYMNGNMMNPYMSGGMSGNSYGSGSASGYDSSSASAGSGGTGYGQAGSGQTASIEPSVLFGLPAANGHLQWPLACARWRQRTRRRPCASNSILSWPSWRPKPPPDR
jgi:hypothetical protein